MVALYAAIAAVVPIPFWLLRDRPENWDCGESAPPGQDAALDDFRAGAIPLHFTAAVVLMMALWAWSARRRGAGAGLPTAWSVVAYGLYITVAVAWNDAYAPLAILSVLALIYVMPILVPGALLAALIVWVRKPSALEGVRYHLVAGTGWALLLVGLPVHFDLVYLTGDGPMFC